MAGNPFHPDELLKSASNYPVTKGDTPGHPFRGNQWTSGTSEGPHYLSENTYMDSSGKSLPHTPEGKMFAEKALKLKDLTQRNLSGVKAGAESWGATRTATTMKVMDIVGRLFDAENGQYDPTLVDKWNNLDLDERHAIEEKAIPQWLRERITPKVVDELEDSNLHGLVRHFTEVSPKLAAQQSDRLVWAGQRAADGDARAQGIVDRHNRIAGMRQ